jgi:hypothetical protein
LKGQKKALTYLSPLLWYKFYTRSDFQENSSSEIFVLRLCIKFGLEYSLSVDDMQDDDTEDSGIVLDVGFS